MKLDDLKTQQCSPCSGNVPGIDPDQIKQLIKQLHNDWQLCSHGKALTRKFQFKGFAKATSLANLCAWLADQQGHHPDIAFGWGYCSVTLTTHDINALSKNDFIWAARLDALVQ